MEIPDRVRRASSAASGSGFVMSCTPEVGALLRTLAAAVRHGGSILELGTGAGVGLGWLVAGLQARTDVSVTSVEVDAATVQLAKRQNWPSYTRIEHGDALEVMNAGRYWNLIFADAPAGKWYGLDQTIDCVADGGIIVFDDMVPPEYISDDDRARSREIRDAIMGDDRLICVEMNYGSGVILATRASRD